MDSDNKWTPYSMAKTAQKTISNKKFDHRTISMNVTLPCILTNNKKHPVINFRNPEGWERYKIVSEEHAQEIKKLVDNIEDINELRIRIHIANMDIQIESLVLPGRDPANKRKDVKETARRSMNCS